jgi:hypothetical protein
MKLYNRVLIDIHAVLTVKTDQVVRAGRVIRGLAVLRHQCHLSILMPGQVHLKT